MRTIEIVVGNTKISRSYGDDDLIWGLPPEKRERKLVADTQRDLIEEADRLANTPYAVRG